MAGARSPKALGRIDLSKQDLTAMVGAAWMQQSPVMVATCRVLVVSRLGRKRRRALFGRTWASLRSMNTPRTRLVRRALPSFAVRRRARRLSVPWRRWPIVATAPELAGLLGLASGADPLPGVPGGTSRALPVPSTMPKTGLVLGESNYPGSPRKLCIATSDRLRHLWIVGPTGAGKSTLITNLAAQDAKFGGGLVVLDARGDLVPDILERIPEHRHDDVIVLDPTSTAYAVGLNPLMGANPEQAAGFTYHALHSIYATSWGPRTADILRASLLTLAHTSAADGQRFTLMDVPELLTNDAFRRYVTAQPLSAELGAFWRWYGSLREAAQLNAVDPVLNKLRAFTLSTPLRSLLGQSEGVDFSEVLNRGKIVVAPLKKGLIGGETSALVGALVISAVWNATLSRANMPQERRRPAWLYVDEFQDVVRLPVDLADILAQARGLGLGLTLAHQFLDHLGANLKAAVTSTARSQVMFQLGEKDASDLAASFSPLKAADLRTLGAYEIALRPCTGGATARPVTGVTFPAVDPITDGDALAAASRKLYGLTPVDIDAQMAARIEVPRPAGRPNRMRIDSEES